MNAARPLQVTRRLYFAFTVAQIQYCRAIAADHAVEGGVLIFSGTTLPKEISLDGSLLSIIHLPASTGRLARKNCVSYGAICKLIEMESARSNDLYFPGFGFPIYNWIYARFRRQQDVVFNIYTEGFSSYLNLKTTLYAKAKFWAFRIFPIFAGGHAGKSINGHPHGYDLPAIRRILTPFPDAMNWAHHPVDLVTNPFQRIELAAVTDEVWFIGQPHLALKTDVETFFRRLAASLQRDFKLALVYKPHHFDSAKSVKAAQAAGFTIAVDPRPVELQLRQVQPRVIVSYRSTALLTARQICSDRTAVISFAPLLCRPPEEVCESTMIVGVLANFGIKQSAPNTALGALADSLQARHHSEGISTRSNENTGTHRIKVTASGIIVASLMARNGSTGVQTHVTETSRYFKSRGVNVGVITPFDGYKLLLILLIGIRRAVEWWLPAAGVLLYRWGHAFCIRPALENAMRDNPDSTIYAQCPISAEVALRIRGRGRQRIVMVVHFNVSQADEWAEKGSIRAGGRIYNAIRDFECLLLPRLDCLIYVSDFMRQTTMRRLPELSAHTSAVIPNFLADPPVRATHTRFSADLLCIGTLEPRKNQGYALEILAAAKLLGSRLTLTIVGDGPDRKALEIQARECGVSAQVTFAGYVKNAADLFDSHRACLHVAAVENFGIVLIEGLARARPVFAVGSGGVPEVFADGQEGRLLSANDAQSAAQAICEWLGSDEAWQNASIRARARFERTFEASVVGERLLGILLCARDDHVKA